MTKKTATPEHIWRLINKDTGEVAYVPARTVEGACAARSWALPDTYFELLEPVWKTDHDGHRAFMLELPCDVCPYQYAQCLRPPKEECPVHHNAAELKRWLKQITQAHLCKYVGKSLTHKQHENQKVLMSREEAATYLRSRPF